MIDSIRLAKRVAELRACSRREAEQIITGGWVRVNGVVVEEPQFRVAEETIEIDGSAGRLDLPDPFGTGPLRLYRADSQAWNEITVDRPDSHRLMIESFMGAIVGKEGVPATAEDAAAAVAAINAIYESARTGRRVTLP